MEPGAATILFVLLDVEHRVVVGCVEDDDKEEEEEEEEEEEGNGCWSAM